MRGKHHIVVESPRLKYEFDIKRNITIIEGDSATGKTTLVDLIRDYAVKGKASPIKIESDVPCEVYSGTEEDWEMILTAKSYAIVFIDEGYSFISTKKFAEIIQSTDNYYVLITRKPLPCLPYSIHEIYGIKTSGRYHFPQQIYHEFYPIYGEQKSEEEFHEPLFISEDSKSGYLFLQSCIKDPDRCTSAEGNSNIYEKIRSYSKNQKLIVIGDGAAFGAFIAKILVLAQYRKNLFLYLPESFEWLVLKSHIFSSNEIDEIIKEPEQYIDSKRYFSWERFFTAYLENLTRDDPIKRYRKQSLGAFYLEEKNKEQILQIFPDEIQKCIRECR